MFLEWDTGVIDVDWNLKGNIPHVPWALGGKWAVFHGGRGGLLVLPS